MDTRVMAAGDIKRPPKRKRKLGEIIAQTILDEIITNGWQPGRNLGTEPELLAKYEVSRATLREAVRQLEVHGAASMKRGAGGGLRVSKPPRSAIVRAMAMFIELTGVSFADQHSLHRQLELTAARLAAKRATPDQIDRLNTITLNLKQAEELPEMVAGAMNFRVAVAEASENPAFPIFVGALNGVMYQLLRVLSGEKRKLQASNKLSNKYKIDLVRKIEDRDPEGAQDIVHRDIERRLKVMNSMISGSRSAKLDAAPSKNRVSHTGLLDPLAPASDVSVKLSEQVAQRMASDISNNGMQPGDSLGHEADLQARYNVSRAVMREAIRQLEPHGIVRARSGFSGGIVVGEVDMDYTVELVRLYLRSTNIQMRHLWEVQSCIEIFAAEQLARVASKDDVLALRQALETLKNVSDRDALKAFSQFHIEIAERTHSRAIGLFVAVLVRYGMDVLPAITPDTRGWLLRTHTRLVDAIDARDEIVANEAMSELFDQSKNWVDRSKKPRKRKSRRRLRSSAAHTVHTY